MMTRYVTTGLLALGLLLSAACTGDDDDDGSTTPPPTAPGTPASTATLPPGEETTIYSGYFETGFELSNFAVGEKCPDGPGWWLSYGEGSNFAEQLEQVTGEPNPSEVTTVFVRFEGIRSDEGEWGHLGAYNYEVEALQVLEMTDAPECA